MHRWAVEPCRRARNRPRRPAQFSRECLP
jgi:hypothetical protein